MISYLNGLAKQILDAWRPNSDIRRPQAGQLNARGLLEEFSRELDRLNTLDFSPDARLDFVNLRGQMRAHVQSEHLMGAKLGDLPERVAVLVEKYNSVGAGNTKRSFVWLSDPDLRDIVRRDYAELSNILLPDGAWKSTVVLAGSILEAILFDILFRDPDRCAKATASPKAPQKGGTVKSEDQWTLENMITVATDIGLLPADRAKTFDQVLRDYRNFVHPRKELRAAHPCGDGEALMAKGALDAVCDHFDRVL